MFLKELAQQFADSDVSYCIVGGFAVNLHGIPRMTYDVDLVVGLTRGNLEKAQSVFEVLGLKPVLPVSLVDFAERSYRDRLLKERNLMAVTFVDQQRPLREVDVLVSPPVAPGKLLDNAVQMVLEDGLLIYVAGLTELIELKSASSRGQDADDLKLLKRIAANGA